VIRAKVDEILKKFPSDEKGKLTVLLRSWTEHNRKHGERFEKWKEKAENPEGNGEYNPVLKAVKQVQEANEQLYGVLTELEHK
jgi:hypothetical protein